MYNWDFPQCLLVHVYKHCHVPIYCSIHHRYFTFLPVAIYKEPIYFYWEPNRANESDWTGLYECQHNKKLLVLLFLFLVVHSYGWPYPILAVLFRSFGFIAPKDFTNYMALQSFEFEHTWWVLFQLHILHTELHLLSVL